jgi:hypothetical protein
MQKVEEEEGRRTQVKPKIPPFHQNSGESLFPAEKGKFGIDGPTLLVSLSFSL